MTSLLQSRDNQTANLLEDRFLFNEPFALEQSIEFFTPVAEELEEDEELEDDEEYEYEDEDEDEDEELEDDEEYEIEEGEDLSLIHI